MARRKKEVPLVLPLEPTPPADIVRVAPEPASDTGEYQAAIDGLSAMVGNYMRENERLRGFLQALVLRGDRLSKAARLMLEQPGMTTEELQKKGLL